MNAEVKSEIAVRFQRIRDTINDLSRTCSANGLAMLYIEKIDRYTEEIKNLIDEGEASRGAESAVETSGAQGAEDKKANSFYEFYGLKLNRYATPGGDVTLIGKRERGEAPAQVYQVVVSRGRDICPNHAVVSCDGRILFRVFSLVNFSHTEHIAISALHQFLWRKVHLHKRANCGGTAAAEQNQVAEAK